LLWLELLQGLDRHLLDQLLCGGGLWLLIVLDASADELILRRRAVPFEQEVWPTIHHRLDEHACHAARPQRLDPGPRDSQPPVLRDPQQVWRGVEQRPDRYVTTNARPGPVVDQRLPVHDEPRVAPHEVRRHLVAATISPTTERQYVERVQ